MPSGENEPVDPQKPSSWRTLKRLFWEAVGPLAIAFLYALWDTYTTVGGFQLAPFLKVFGAAFFLFMWLTGQFLRVRKQLHDVELLSGLTSHVQAIRQALDIRAAAQGTPAPVNPDSVAIADPVAREMIDDAERARGDNLHYQALLVAARAFEHSIRELARRLLIGGPDLPMRRLLKELHGVLPTGVLEELDNLWDARNRIVHTATPERVRRDAAQRLLDGFKWAVALLSSIQPNEKGDAVLGQGGPPLQR